MNKIYNLKKNKICSSFVQSFVRVCLAVMAMLWFGALSIKATTFYVATNSMPQSPYTNWADAATNIQNAVNVATNTGDIVLVSNGVYTTTTPTSAGGANNIVVLTNQITLKSVNGPVVTVIDGNYPAQSVRGVYITSNAKLDGFTVRNGAMPYAGTSGGGIYLSDATVTNCIVHNNYSDRYGGGISVKYAGANNVVANCAIYSNTAQRGQGGGMEIAYTTLAIINNCVFWKNKNTATTDDGGGGGLQIYGSKAIVKNCLFYQNDCYVSGGGIIVINSGDSVLENCTITENTSTNNGGGVYVWDSTSVAQTRNLIIYNNSASLNYADAWMASANVLTNCCIRDTNGVPNWNTSGNITNNPQFVDRISGNYRLQANSPCVNTGTNQSWMTGAVDLDGRTRIRYGTVDMGAYEAIYEGSVYNFH